MFYITAQTEVTFYKYTLLIVYVDNIQKGVFNEMYVNSANTFPINIDTNV